MTLTFKGILEGLQTRLPKTPFFVPGHLYLAQIRSAVTEISYTIKKTRLTAPKTTFCTSLRVVTKADENKSCLLLIVYLADFQPSLKSPFVYCTTHGSIPQARTHFPRVFPDFCSFFPYFSLTTFKFPDFYIFSRLVATLNIFC